MAYTSHSKAHFPPTEAELNGCANNPEGPIDPINVYASGSTIDIQWNVTKTHPSDPGVRIAIQFPGESTFTVLKDKIPAGDGKATVQLPSGKTSDKAVLHWSWGVESEKAFYMSCADITIKPGNAAVGSTIEPQKSVNVTAETTTVTNGTVSVSATSNNGTVGVSATSNNGTVSVTTTPVNGEHSVSNGSTTVVYDSSSGAAVTTEQKTDTPAARTETVPQPAAPLTENKEEELPDCEEIITSTPGEVTLPTVKTVNGTRVKTVIETVVVYKCAS